MAGKEHAMHTFSYTSYQIVVLMEEAYCYRRSGGWGGGYSDSIPEHIHACIHTHTHTHTHIHTHTHTRMHTHTHTHTRMHTHILFTIDCLPFDESERKLNMSEQNALLEYVNSLEPMKVAQYVKRQDNEQLRTFEGESTGYNQRLQETNTRAAEALDKTQKKEQELTAVGELLKKCEREITNMDTSDTVIVGLLVVTGDLIGNQRVSILGPSGKSTMSKGGPMATVNGKTITKVRTLLPEK